MLRKEFLTSTSENTHYDPKKHAYLNTCQTSYVIKNLYLNPSCRDRTPHFIALRCQLFARIAYLIVQIQKPQLLYSRYVGLSCQSRSFSQNVWFVSIENNLLWLFLTVGVSIDNVLKLNQNSWSFKALFCDFSLPHYCKFGLKCHSLLFGNNWKLVRVFAVVYSAVGYRILSHKR